MNNLVIYGGSFDPIHNGHINTAINIQKYFNFDALFFIPCKLPLLKAQSLASPQQRVDMINLTIAQQASTCPFKMDPCEITRASPSYTTTTLQDYRRKYGKDTALNLIMGMDSFFQLPQWHNWEKLLALGNILLIKRPGLELQEAPKALQKLLEKHQTLNHEDLLKHSHGLVYYFDAGSYEISSSKIREFIRNGEDVSALLPESVLAYIRENRIYSSGMTQG